MTKTAATRPNDLFGSLPANDPYAVYHAQRAQDPVQKTPRGWIVTRHVDALSVLRDPKFGRLGIESLVTAAFAAPDPDIGASMLFLDPPDHTRLRSLVSRAFSPRAVALMRSRIEAQALELLSAWEDGATVDFVGDCAYPLAIRINCAMLGVPPEDWRFFRQWSFDFARVLDNVGLEFDPGVAERGAIARKGLTGYFRDRLIPERRHRPTGDLLSDLIAAESDGAKLTEPELLATCNFMMVAGQETTVHLLSSGLLSLLRNPDQCEALRSDAELASRAVDEMLRYESPVQITTRVAHQTVTLGDSLIAAGDMVFIVIGAANRDPARYPEPDRFDIARDSRDHLAFGSGIHYCLGSALARMEGEILFPMLLRTFPRLELETSVFDWRPSVILRSLDSLPVSVHRS